VKCTPLLRDKRALIDAQCRRPALIAKGKRDDRLPIVRSGLFPAKRVDETGGRVDLAKHTREVKQLAVGRLHRDSVDAAHVRFELDAWSSKPLRPPPFRQLVRLDQGAEHDRARSGENTLEMQR
jgi:hypothetical protein